MNWYGGFFAGQLTTLGGVVVINIVLGWPAWGWIYVRGLALGILGTAVCTTGGIMLEVYRGGRRVHRDH